MNRRILVIDIGGRMSHGAIVAREIGIPCVAPAIANAVFQITGKRLRHLPMSPDRVRKALA